MEALKYARTCLTPGGSLIVIGQHPSRWVDFVFGADHKHWSLSKDTPFCQINALPHSGNNSCNNWVFPIPASLKCPRKSCPAHICYWPNRQKRHYHHVLTPVRLCPVAGCCWQTEGFSAQLSNILTNNLQTRGDIVVQACPGDTASISSLLHDTTPAMANSTASSTWPDSVTSKPMSTLKPLSTIRLPDALTVASIVQACEITQTNTTCWLITTVRQLTCCPIATSAKTQTTIIPGDAALWGLVER